MKFETGRTIVKICLLLSVVFCVFALITQTNSADVAQYLMIGAICCIVLTVFFAATALKCPYCGKTIFKKCLVVKVCPHCRRDLGSGTKVKNKKIK